jgi:hypothetical protein
MGRTPPTALVAARILAHNVLQWPAKAARANLKAAPDDSQSSFDWDHGLGALVSQPLPTKTGEVRVGLRLAALELLIVRGSGAPESFPLQGKTETAAGAWLDSRLQALGLKAASSVKLPYAVPDYPRAGGAALELAMLRRELGELSRWFAGPAEALEDFRAKLTGLRPGPEPVRCWPHHFDMATLVRLEKGEPARSVGVGVSPGDEYYAQPYAYVSPWPRFDRGTLPDLPPPGRWHTDGFLGAVATGEDILALRDRGPAFVSFITGAFEIGRARLESY